MTQSLRALLVIVSLGGCVENSSGPTQVEAESLAALTDAKLAFVLGHTLFIATNTQECLALPSDVHVQLDGIEGALYRGGELGSGGSCTIAQAQWNGPPVTDVPTFTVSDTTTTWTFAVDRPVDRGFELVGAPTDPTFQVGDAVTLRLTPASGAMSEPRVDVAAVSRVTVPLTRVGDDLSFTMPDVGSGTAVIEVSARVDPTILTCTVPGGCEAAISAASTIAITIAP